MEFALPNKRVNLTNHGHDSKLRPTRGRAVVSGSTAVRWAEEARPSW
jgi:hypothetical protein